MEIVMGSRWWGRDGRGVVNLGMNCKSRENNLYLKNQFHWILSAKKIDQLGKKILHRSEAELRTTCDTRGLKQYDLQEITKVTSNDEIEKGTTVSVQKVQYKTVQHRTVRKKFKLNKKTVRYKTDGKTVRSNNCFSKPVGQKVFNKHERQNSDCRSRANVLRACQQRVGLYTKIIAGYRHKAATRS